MAAPSLASRALTSIVPVAVCATLGWASLSRALTGGHVPICVDNKAEIETGQERLLEGPLEFEDLHGDEPPPAPVVDGSVGDYTNPSEVISCEDGSGRFRLTVWENEADNCRGAWTGCAFMDESAPGGCASGVEETDWMEGWDGLAGDPFCHRPDLVWRRTSCGMQRFFGTVRSYYYEIEAQACDGDGIPCFGPTKVDSGCVEVNW